MENYHILKVITLGWTNTKPNRVKIVSERFKQSVTISYSNDPGSLNPAIDTAVEYLKVDGFKFIGQGESKDGYYLISTTFEPIK